MEIAKLSAPSQRLKIARIWPTDGAMANGEIRSSKMRVRELRALPASTVGCTHYRSIAISPARSGAGTTRLAAECIAATLNVAQPAMGD